MKTYTTKPNEDLGSIARKFGMPSWKYLYRINKDKIGDNPDLLKEGTVLEIPQWDSTSGDEKIKAKDADPFKYTGGVRYRYPWVPFSVSLVKSGTTPADEFEEDREVVIEHSANGALLYKGTVKKSDEIECLLPDSAAVNVGIKGYPMVINGVHHRHPDDRVQEMETQETKSDSSDTQESTILGNI